MYHALVVPNHSNLFCGALFGKIFGCIGHASSADFRRDVATAEEDAIERVGGVLASCGVVEFEVVCGVGREWREEGAETRFVETIGAESGVCTDVV